MANNLITLAEYKAYAGLSSTTQDIAISAIIPKVSTLVKTLCRRTFNDFVDTAKEEVFPKEHKVLLLAETPVVSVSSLKYSEDYGQTLTSLVEMTDYVIDGDSIEILNPLYYGTTRRVRSLFVSYTAGYDTIPDDLKLAVCDLVKYYLSNDSAIHSNKSPGTNSVQIEYVSTTSLPAHIKRILDQYTAHY